MFIILSFVFAIFAGIGLGHVYLPSIIIVSYYFQKRRAFATGVAVCGSGAGCFVLAPVGKVLLEKYRWKGAMLILSALTLNCCVFSALLRPLKPVKRSNKRIAVYEDTNVADKLVVIIYLSVTECHFKILKHQI